jgi:uncharacterized protein (TIRG00374 family)
LARGEPTGLIRGPMLKLARRWLKPATGVAVTVGFLWLLGRGLDIRTLWQAIARLSLPILTLALAFLTIDYACRIVRWWWMLRAFAPHLPLGACAWPFLTSIAVNNVMPLRAGDALRVFGFRRQLRSPAARVLGTLVIERILDLIVLIGFFFVGLFGLPPGKFPERFIHVAAWLAGGCVVAVLALVLLAPWLASLIRRIEATPAVAQRKWAAAAAGHGLQLIDVMAVLKSPARLIFLLGLSILAWSFEGAVFATVARAVDSGAGASGPWFAMATGTLATLIPSSPGYVGTFDYFAAQGLAAYGSPSAVAVAFALTVHAILWAPLTIAGLAYLFFHGARLWSDTGTPEGAIKKGSF